MLSVGFKKKDKSPCLDQTSRSSYHRFTGSVKNKQRDIRYYQRNLFYAKVDGKKSHSKLRIGCQMPHFASYSSDVELFA